MIHCTLYKNIFDNKITEDKRFSGSWEDFCHFLSTPIIIPKKEDAPLITPVKFLDEQHAVSFTDHGFVRRCKDNVELWYMLPIDIDGQMSIEDAYIKFKKYEYVLYTSFNHQTVKKPYDCFRIFFLLKTPVSNQDFMARTESLKEFIEFLDPSSVSISRAFYLPSCSADKKEDAFYHWNKGELLDIMEFKPIERVEQEIQKFDDAPSEELKNKVYQKLWELSDIYYESPRIGEPSWWKVCSAMIDGGYSFEEFEAVSAVLRQNHPDRNCRGQWNSSKSKPISFGYLVNILKNRFGDSWLQNERPQQSSFSKKAEEFKKKMKEYR